jgi:hypothetical protein
MLTRDSPAATLGVGYAPLPEERGAPAEYYLPEHPDDPMQCRVCGCTDLDCSGCIERTGHPCYWVHEDLCSACGSTPASPGASLVEVECLVERLLAAILASLAVHLLETTAQGDPCSP